MPDRSERVYSLFGTDVHEWAFSNGFRLVLIRDRDTTRKMGMVTIKGGSTTPFDLQDTHRKHTPPGLAHFLEHILFDREDGKAHAKFAACNALSNAFTSYVSTAFFFTTIEEYAPCLDILLQSVLESNFHEGMVRREKEVILQELAMYEDDPDYMTDLAFMRRIGRVEQGDIFNILGTRESLATISAEQIRSFHESNYRPDRMLLVMIGDLEPEKLLEQVVSVEGLMAPTGETLLDSVLPDCEERSEPYQGEVEIGMDIGQQIGRCGWQLPLDGAKAVVTRKLAAVQVLLEAMFGRFADLPLRLEAEGRLVEPLEVRTELLSDRVVVILETAGPEVTGIGDEVLATVETLTRTGLSESLLEAARNKLYGEWVLMYDDMPNFLYEFSDLLIRGIQPADFIEALSQVRSEEIRDVLAELTKERFLSVRVTGRGDGEA
ncbi:MAG TPA: pitrilysin family protein [Bacilli bacterium]|nr:pitrilysin family protein [Bacilli bacterium]